MRPLREIPKRICHCISKLQYLQSKYVFFFFVTVIHWEHCQLILPKSVFKQFLIFSRKPSMSQTYREKKVKDNNKQILSCKKKPVSNCFPPLIIRLAWRKRLIKIKIARFFRNDRHFLFYGRHSTTNILGCSVEGVGVWTDHHDDLLKRVGSSSELSPVNAVLVATAVVSSSVPNSIQIWMGARVVPPASLLVVGTVTWKDTKTKWQEKLRCFGL